LKKVFAKPKFILKLSPISGHFLLMKQLRLIKHGTTPHVDLPFMFKHIVLSYSLYTWASEGFFPGRAIVDFSRGSQ